MARRPGGVLACEILVIESIPAAVPIGYIAYHRRPSNGLVSLRAFELRRGTSWLAPTASVVAHLHQWLRQHPDSPGRGVRFALPAGHPAARCASTRLGWAPSGSYGLYIRVPDVVAFLRAIAPALEARLAVSPAVAWTGELRIDLYQGGILLRFDQGRLSAIEPLQPEAADASESTVDASMTRDDFLHLLFGNRTIHELESTTADCLLKSDAGALLLNVLFPRMPTSTWEFC